MIKNILWGFEGALFDTSSAMTFAVSQTLSKMGFLAPMNVIDRLVRQSFDHCALTFSKRLNVDAETLHSQFIETYLKVSPSSQAPFPGADMVCNFIHSQGGVNVGITHFSVQSAQTLLDAHHLSPLFSNAILKVQWDPTQIALTLKSVFGRNTLCSAETLLISHNNVDIQSAKAAGVLTGLFGQSPLTQSADMHIKHYNQLLTYLQDTGI